MVGVSTAIPAASLCINRRLYRIACIRVVAATKADKRRAIMVDLAIGVGLPVLVMILRMLLYFLSQPYTFPDEDFADYIIQGHRFNIFEDVGCFPATYYTWPIYPILYLPPIIIGLFSGTYATLTIIAFYKNSSQFNALMSTNSNITSNRFIRLMCLAGVEILFNIPISIYGISIQSRVPLNPYISWENVHFDFSHVEEIPSVIWRSNNLEETSLELQRWAIVFCAFIFFIFFGFADEARKNYRYAFQSVAKRVGLSTGPSSNGINSSDFGTNGCVESSSYYGETFLSLTTPLFSYISRMKSKVIGSSGKFRPVLPIFVQQEMLQRHNSMDSFSNMSIEDVSGVLNEKSLSSSSSSSDTKVDNSPQSSPSPSFLALSSASSITYLSPARTRQDSGIEFSSPNRDSSYSSYTESIYLPPPNSQQQPRSADHSAV